MDVKKRKKEPGKRCVVMFCNKTNADNVSLHQFPSNEVIRKKWIAFVLQKRDPKGWTQGTGYICSDHFTEEDYNGYGAKQAGFMTKLVLKKESVPSINPFRRDSVDLLTTKKLKVGTQMECSTKLRCTSQALIKLSAHRTLQATTDSTDSTISEECQETVVGDQCDPSPDESVAIQCSTSSCNKGTQKSIQKPERRSKGVQADVTKQDAGIQCNLVNLPPLLDSLQNFSDDENSSKELDSDYVPSSDSEQEMEFQPTKHKSSKLHNEKKFIVFESYLLSLFELCPNCGGNAKGSIAQVEGTLVKVKQQCDKCKFCRTWCSQPFIRRMPAGNLLLSTCILLSGCSVSKVLRMLRLMNLACISSSSYYRHARSYINPSVIQFWKSNQQEVIGKLHELENGLIVAGDGRCDSPGHSAKFGSFTLIEQQINKVIDFELVQSNEVKNSSWMENEGLARAVQKIKDSNLEIVEIITDRHKQNTPWIKRHLPNAKHYFDIWHVSKGLCKKIDKIAKRKKFSDLGEWKESISNHMYWCAADTPDGDGEKMKEKWSILPLHIQNIHTNPLGNHYKECGHGNLQGDARNRLWIEAGSEVAVKMEDLLLKKNLLEDISKLSPKYQTSTLEAKHSLDIQFAPKHTAFSYWGMYTRLCLSAIHYNTNSDRMQKVSKNGRPMYAIRFPKAKKGKYSVRPIKTDPSYEYCIDIIDRLFDKYQTYAEAHALKVYMNQLKANTPGPLSDELVKPDKDEAIISFVTRYYQSSLVN